MNCPACGQPLPVGRQRCPSCGRIVALEVEGSLAPDPLSERGTAQPLREVPGLKKREQAWKDEVRNRVRLRRLQRGAPVRPRLGSESELAAAPRQGLSVPEDSPAAIPVELGDVDSAFVTTEKMQVSPALPDAELPEDPLEGDFAAELAEADPLADETIFTDEPSSGEWDLQPALDKAQPSPIERPAYLVERVQAAAIDLALMVGLWIMVVYLASRAARVPVDGLRGAWLPLGSYLVLFGLVYAAYFTGISGRTLGKIVAGLKVVDRSGRPPSIRRALMRAVVGTMGILLAAAGIVPMLFDPARRAFHDRLLGTRVVRL